MIMVSVIIPAYQAKEFIVRALSSVLQQGYRPIQIIVVNDGSRDALEGTVAEFCKQNQLVVADDNLRAHDKIKKSWCRVNPSADFSLLYIEKKNGGPSSARNLGLELAEGDYVAFLDADDQWLPEKLRNQIACLENNAADVVFSDISIEKNNETYIDSVDKRHRWNIPETSGEDLFWFKKLLEYNFIITSTLLIRKSCLGKIDWFDETINHGEDYDFVLRLALFFEFVYCQLPTCRKFIHDNNLSNDEIRFYDNKIYILKKVFSKYGDMLKKRKVNYSGNMSKTYRNYAYYCYLNKNYSGMLKKYLYHFYYARIAPGKFAR